MPIFKRDDVELYYEEHGAGFPILLVAPGGMRSAVAFWERTPWNPITQLAPRYRVIAMDQRNAGQSVAPIRATDSWHAAISGDLLRAVISTCYIFGFRKAIPLPITKS